MRPPRLWSEAEERTPAEQYSSVTAQSKVECATLWSSFRFRLVIWTELDSDSAALKRYTITVGRCQFSRVSLCANRERDGRRGKIHRNASSAGAECGGRGEVGGGEAPL
jgi:hypothetical protein